MYISILLFYMVYVVHMCSIYVYLEGSTYCISLLRVPENTHEHTFPTAGQ